MFLEFVFLIVSGGSFSNFVFFEGFGRFLESFRASFVSFDFLQVFQRFFMCFSLFMSSSGNNSNFLTRGSKTLDLTKGRL